MIFFYVTVEQGDFSCFIESPHIMHIIYCITLLHLTWSCCFTSHSVPFVISTPQKGNKVPITVSLLEQLFTLKVNEKEIADK